jgi:hypothetical protein
MEDFLVEAQKLFWRFGRKVTPEYREAVKNLLLAKLAKFGDITEDDSVWAESICKDFLRLQHENFNSRL